MSADTRRSLAKSEAVTEYRPSRKSFVGKTSKGEPARSPERSQFARPARGDKLHSKVGISRPSGRNTKQKFCMYHFQGACQLSGDKCDYAHSLEEMHEASGSHPRQGKGKALRPQTGQADRERPLVSSARKEEQSTAEQATAKQSTAKQSTAGSWLHLGEPVFLQPSMSLQLAWNRRELPDGSVPQRLPLTSGNLDFVNRRLKSTVNPT